MPTPEALLAFALAAAVLIVIPGPSVLFVIGRTLSYGIRGGLMSVLGNALGLLPIIAAVAFGVGALIAQSVALFTGFKLLGAGYLVFLGVQAIRHRGDGLDKGVSPSERSLTPMVMLWQGVIVGVTNPKTIVFFVAVLPQFVSYLSGMIPTQMMVLGLVFVVLALLCDSVWVLIAGTAQHWFSRSARRVRGIRAAGGGLMIGLGGVLALTGNTS